MDWVRDEPQGGEGDGDDVTGRLRDREQGGGDATDGEHGGPLLLLIYNVWIWSVTCFSFC